MSYNTTYTTAVWSQVAGHLIKNSSNQTSQSNRNELPFIFGTTAQVGYTLFAAIVITFALLGNVTIIHIVRTRPNMLSNPNILISNLAFSDILMVPTCLYMTKYLFVGYQWFGGTFGLVSCKVISSLTIASLTSSVYTILFIAVERFCAVIRPLRKILHRKGVMVLVFLIWLGAVACSVPEGMMVTVKSCSDHVYCCARKTPSLVSYRKYTTGLISVTYIIPLVAIFTLYLITGYKLWVSKAPGHDLYTHAQSVLLKRKAIRMLATVVVVFTLCWFPLYMAEILKMYKTKFYYTSVPIEVQFLLPWFGVANSAINPYLFPIFCEKFRREFQLSLGCPSSRRFIPSSQSSIQRQSRMKTSLSFVELKVKP